MKSTKTYLAYGVRIETSLPIEDLPLSDGTADVTIREDLITDRMVEELTGVRTFESPRAEFRFSPRAMFARWERVGKVLAVDGKEVIIEKEEGATEADLEPFVTGPILAALLHQRGFFVLHASCVSINGAAVVFVGPKGHGKSTLAALLKARGHRVISDDLVPLSVRDRCIRIEPGFPRIKLYDDSLEAIGANPTDHPTIHRFASKRSLQLNDVSNLDPISLRAVYILHEGSELQITQLPRASAFIEIMKNAHLGRFLDATESQTRYFQLCSEITQTVPAFLLERPGTFEEMPRFLVSLEQHTYQITDGPEPSRPGPPTFTAVDLL